MAQLAALDEEKARLDAEKARLDAKEARLDAKEAQLNALPPGDPTYAARMDALVAERQALAAAMQGLAIDKQTLGRQRAALLDQMQGASYLVLAGALFFINPHAAAAGPCTPHSCAPSLMLRHDDWPETQFASKPRFGASPCLPATRLPVALCTPAPARPALCHRLRAR